MSDPIPTRTTIRAYQVGFGDCFLMTVHYDDSAGGDRHVLIDFGTTALPKRPRRSTKHIAEHIAETVDNKLHAVVATHRHKDHISGFSGSAGEIIRSLNPDVVVQPWTEDPALEADASAPGATFVADLARMQTIAGHARDQVRGRANGRERRFGKSVREEIDFIGDDNLSNREAVENLASMGGHNVYTHYGEPSGLESVLPGVAIHVLGPPTVEQYNAITRQRSEDTDEFWHFQERASLREHRGRPLFPKAKTWGKARVDLPLETRWLMPRLDRIRGEQLLQIVRVLDRALNNTSLILLFEIGRRKFLFSGDAQIENWEYCLKHAPDKADKRKLLEQVDYYKVGHHGSLNATPKTLWGLFKNRGDESMEDRMTSSLSTMGGKHGQPHRGTEVPRTKLTDALKAETNYQSTQSLLSGGAPFNERTYDV